MASAADWAALVSEAFAFVSLEAAALADANALPSDFFAATSESEAFASETFAADAEEDASAAFSDAVKEEEVALVSEVLAAFSDSLLSQRIGRIGIDVHVSYQGPVNGTGRPHSDIAIDGNLTVLVHLERNQSGGFVSDR